jgi:predicted dehydrogenase
MADQIRWGILATGGIAHKFADDLRLLEDARITAVGSRRATSAASFAAEYDIPSAHASWEQLAQDPNVDVIYVATPHHAHLAASLTCVRAGKAVLTEKPFTMSRATSQLLVDQARVAGGFLMEGMWTRCFPAVRKALELVADGAIGELTAVHADFGLSGPFPPEHRLVNPELGGGALLDLGIYPVSFAHLFLGEPERISAWAALTEQGVDQNTAISLSYPSGALAQLSCSLVGGTPCRAAVTGTRGRIEFPSGFFHPDHFDLYRPGVALETMRFAAEGLGYHYEAAEVQRCLRAGLTESPLVPLDETLTIMGTMDRIRGQIGVEYAAETAA